MDIVTREMDLTDSLKLRVNEKIEKTLQKLGHDVLSASVVLRVIKFPITGIAHRSRCKFTTHYKTYSRVSLSDDEEGLTDRRGDSGI